MNSKNREVILPHTPDNTKSPKYVTCFILPPRISNSVSVSMSANIVRQPQEVLETLFGYQQFRSQQAAIIDAVIAGRDALVIMPTGGGKSLCYQVPSLCLDGLGIVVSPLIALMADQVASLNQLGVRAAYLNSTQEFAVQNDVIEKLRRGELDLLYVAPERLLQDQTLEVLRQVNIALIAVDEAHCVSSWGHDFRRDYLELHALRQHFPGVPRIALTATADERTREDIAHNLQLDTPEIFIDGFDRSNIHYRVALKSSPKSQLLEFLAQRKTEAGIVYCLSRRAVDSTAAMLVDNGYDALPYHAGLDTAVRAKHQERFLREDAVIVVATIAFGMGIDKPDVRFVAHMDLPKSIEAYYQETGRAGRDGEPAQAWMVYGLQDVVRMSQMLSESQADETHKRIENEKLNALLGWCEVTTCRRAALLNYFGDRLQTRCSGCDVCDLPPKTWNALEAAQKFLSCVVRTGQRFGAGHVIDVLRGADKERIQQLNHDTLPTFGIGADLNDAQWRSVVRQLIAQGYLYADATRHGGLRLSEHARPLLRGDVPLQLREDATLKHAGSKSRSTRSRAEPAIELSELDAMMFEELRATRKRLADDQGVPPYVIFHDATLREMAQLRPATLNELLGLNGVGQTKLERYGATFLATLVGELEVPGAADNAVADWTNEADLSQVGPDYESLPGLEAQYGSWSDREDE